jgi:hypothetical protein
MADYSASNLSHAQREYVEETIEFLVEQEADFYGRLEAKAEEKPTNYRGRRIPLETIANPSLMFGNPAGGDLASTGSPTNNHYLIPYVWMNLGLGIDYESLLNESRGTISSPLERAVESTGKQMAKWLNIYASQGDGTTKLATSSAAYDGTNATTKKTFVCNGATDTIGATNVVPGQKGYVYDPTGTTQRIGTVGSGVLTISTSQTSKTSILTTTDLPSDYLSGDIFVPEGATPSTGFHGVPSLCNNTGTLFGINRANVPTTQSVMVAAGGGLSAALLYSTYTQLRQRNGGKKGMAMAKVELCMGETQDAAYYGLTVATAQLLFPRDGAKRPNIDIGGDDPDQFTWFGLRMNNYLNWLGSRIDFVPFNQLKIARLKKGGEMLAPFDKPLPAINGATSTYKAAQQQWWDVAEEFYSPALHRFGALTGLTVSGLPMQKS